MVRFQDAPRQYGAAAAGPARSFGFSDAASYATDTSSITNPVGIGFSMSSEDEDDDNNDDDEVVSFVDSATSALTGLTGWTSANGGGGAASRGGGGATSSRAGRSRGMGMSTLGEISELGEVGGSNSEENNFPIAHSKSYKSQGAESAAISEMQSEQISAISFETSLDEVEAEQMPRVGSYGSQPRKRGGGGKGVKSTGGNNGGPPPISPTSSLMSHGSNGSKKRAPVPPLRDPGMEDREEDQMWEEDCNYDINPTLVFLVLESHDWKESISLLDGKGLENKNETWNLGSLFGGGKRRGIATDVEELSKKRQKELRGQARTWIVRRERTGKLRWRMLPLHAALAFNAPFDVVLRLYHLYPGAVRCRNDQGMLPLHHVFKYGNEDKVMELLLDVFPEALTVVDDKGRLPLACTPKDDSDNARRSNILTLFSNFQVELAAKKESEAAAETAAEPAPVKTEPKPAMPSIQPPRTPLSPIAAGPEEEEGNEGTLGAAPRYTSNAPYVGPMTFNSMKPPTKKPAEPQPEAPRTPLSPKGDDGKVDRYALPDGEDSENVVPLNKGINGLSPIPEEGGGTPKGVDRGALKSELLALGEKKKRRGLKKILFGKKRMSQI